MYIHIYIYYTICNKYNIIYNVNIIYVQHFNLFIFNRDTTQEIMKNFNFGCFKISIK